MAATEEKRKKGVSNGLTECYVAPAKMPISQVQVAKRTSKLKTEVEAARKLKTEVEAARKDTVALDLEYLAVPKYWD